MAKNNRISVMLSDSELAALDSICEHYGFSRSKMLAKLVLQSKRKVDDTPLLEKQLNDLQSVLAQFEATQTHISGGGADD